MNLAKKLFAALFIFSTFPLCALAQTDTATSTPLEGQVLGVSTAATATPEQIQAARDLIRQKLLNDEFTSQDADSILNDPRLKLDPSVVYAYTSSTGKGFNYFSASFGLTSKKAIKDAMDFRRKNWKYFQQAYKEYGVESYYILGIFRLETYFGTSIGRRDVPSTLYSIFVLDPRRQKFAYEELTNLLNLSADNSTDPFNIKGSSAGAFGIPQFIPSSFANFAIDGNDDGNVDLFDPADAILSTARYLNENGWGGTVAKKKSAVYAYNHDNGYVNAVIAFGKTIRILVEGK